MPNEPDVSLSTRIKQVSFDLNQNRTLGTKYLTEMADFLLLSNYLNEQKNGPNPTRPVNFGGADDPGTEENEKFIREIDFVAKMENKLGKSIDDINEEDARNEGLRLLRIKIGYIDITTSDLELELADLRSTQQANNPGSV